MVEELTLAIKNADKWFWDHHVYDVPGWDPAINSLSITDYDKSFFDWLKINYGVLATSEIINSTFIKYEVTKIIDHEKATMFKLKFG